MGRAYDRELQKLREEADELKKLAPPNIVAVEVDPRMRPGEWGLVRRGTEATLLVHDEHRAGAARALLGLKAVA